MSKLPNSKQQYPVKKWTSRCVKTGHRFHELVIYTLLLTSIFSCGRVQDKANRPSPLVSDSISIDGQNMSIAYSSPRARGRAIWNELVPFDKVWRTGANEATVFESNTPIVIENQYLPAGKYSLFSIPTANDWIIIFNTDWEQWGAYNYDSTKDQLRLTVSPYRHKEFKEEMTFALSDTAIHFHWKNLAYKLKYKTAQ
jgi:hypothetical protein